MQSNSEAHNKIADLSTVSNSELPGALVQVLRSDPDIVVVGEGRESDAQAAQAVNKASMTGHLIVSQLPTH
ncbi:ATPase, T2SS/T4P/T4SS family [Pandoraea sputorum]